MFLSISSGSHTTDTWFLLRKSKQESLSGSHVSHWLASFIQKGHVHFHWAKAFRCLNFIMFFQNTDKAPNSGHLQLQLLEYVYIWLLWRREVCYRDHRITSTLVINILYFPRNREITEFIIQVSKSSWAPTALWNSSRRAHFRGSSAAWLRLSVSSVLQGHVIVTGTRLQLGGHPCLSTAVLSVLQQV